jgi:hypothetical protein
MSTLDQTDNDRPRRLGAAILGAARAIRIARSAHRTGHVARSLTEPELDDPVEWARQTLKAD